MPTTPKGLPYPATSDPVAQGANAIKALATYFDTKLDTWKVGPTGLRGLIGLTGLTGPRGLPGVNAVENDTAVAAYIAAADSLTADALVAAIGEQQHGFGFAASENVTLDAGTTFSAVETIGDVVYATREGGTIYTALSVDGPFTLVKLLGAPSIINFRDPGDGEILLSRGDNKIYKSSGWASNPATATFAAVLTTGNVVPAFSFDADPVSGWVVVTNYALPGDMSTSRYLWLSKDRGATWAIIHDTTTTYPNVDPSYSHCHVAALDPYHSATTPRIWHTFHKTVDDPTSVATPFKRIIYSDNAGATWTKFSSDFIQPVLGVATKRGMIFDTDMTPNALYVVERTANPANQKLVKAWEDRSTVAQSGWAAHAVRGSNGAVHIVFRSVVAGIAGLVVSTDGWRFTKTLTIPPATPADTVDVTNMTIDPAGRLMAVIYQTASDPGVPHNPVFDEPLRGAITPVNSGDEGGTAASLGIANGPGAMAGIRAVARGVNASAEAMGVAHGYGAKADIEGVAIGNLSEASEQGISVGSLGKALGLYALNIGRGGIASGLRSMNFGRGGIASHTDSINFGVANAGATTADSQIQFGSRHSEIRAAATPPVPGANAARYLLRPGTGGLEWVMRFPNGKTQTIATEVGVVRTPAYTTANRPTAATAAAGGCIFDTTIGKPIWSNGAAWVDATGATV